MEADAVGWGKVRTRVPWSCKMPGRCGLAGWWSVLEPSGVRVVYVRVGLVERAGTLLSILHPVGGLCSGADGDDVGGSGPRGLARCRTVW